MNEKRKAKLLFYVFTIQLISILFALLIEKATDLIVKKFNINLDMEILYLLIILIFLAVFMYVVYKQIHSLLLFEPISNQIASSREKNNFYQLLKKIKNKETLTEYQQSKLQSYIDNSPLPKDFITKHTNSLNFTIWERSFIIITIVYLSLSLKLHLDEHHRNNEQVS